MFGDESSLQISEDANSIQVNFKAPKVSTRKYKHTPNSLIEMSCKDPLPPLNAHKIPC